MREKCNVFLLCIMLFFTAIAANATQVWDGTSAKWTKGSGTEKDPYLIESPNQLAFLSEMVSAGISDYSGKYFKQTQDFDMKSLVLEPIGISAAFPFKGNYNGNNKSISNLQISGNNSNQHIALFGYVSGSTIENVIVKGSFSCTMSSKNYTAGILAYGTGVKLSNCKNMANIAMIGTNDNIKNTYVAGIIAYASDICTLTNCFNAGSVNVSRSESSRSMLYSFSGGIVGCCDGTCTLIKCSNIGAVNSFSSEFSNFSVSGGIVGRTMKGGKCTLTYCSNAGTISSSSLGDNDNPTSISGGLLGVNSCTCELTNSFNRGSVSGTIRSTALSTSYACSGGMVGYCGNNISIKNCYAHCEIRSIAKQAYAYGIAMAATIKHSYFAGTLTGTSQYGILSSGEVTNCYFNSDCGASTSSYYGTAKTTAQLKSASMPILLNDSETGTTWVMDTNNSNDGYPIFGWQAAPTYKITATCNESHGSVSGGGNYTKGTVVTLTATPKGGYIFSGWSDGKKTNPRSVTVGTSDATYTALFVKMRYVITVNQDCSVNVQ